jgi:hypothetical protein
MLSFAPTSRSIELPPRRTPIKIARLQSSCVIAASLIAIATLTPRVAAADVGLGNPVAIGFGSHPRLLPTLHATASAEAGSWSYTAKGYFKIAGKTVARLPSFHGTADTVLRTTALNVSTSARHQIGIAARRHNAKRVTLTVVIKATRSDGTSGSFSQDAFLTLPKR